MAASTWPLAHGGSSELRRSTIQPLSAVRAPRGPTRVSRLLVGVRQHLCPAPSSRAPLLILMPVARNAEGALCAVRSYRAERAGGGSVYRYVPVRTGVNQLQARASEFLEHHASPMPLSQERRHKHTIHHKSHMRGAGRGAARPPGGGDTVPKCTVCQAATTGGVPVNCAVQPALPHALITFSCIHPTVPETGELHAEIGNDAEIGAVKWPDQAS